MQVKVIEIKGTSGQVCDALSQMCDRFGNITIKELWMKGKVN